MLLWLRTQWQRRELAWTLRVAKGELPDAPYHNTLGTLEGEWGTRILMLCSKVGLHTFGYDFDLRYSVYRYSRGAHPHEWDHYQGVDRSVNTHWHTDNEDRRVLKMVILLHDVDEECGPFCYMSGTNVCGSRSRELRETLTTFFRTTRLSWRGSDEFVQWYAANAFLERVPLCLKRCTGVSGTVFFVDTAGFHKGGDPFIGRERLCWFAGLTSKAPWPISKWGRPSTFTQG